jgi:Bacterial PH domain
VAEWGQAEVEWVRPGYHAPVFRPVGADPAYCVGWFRSPWGRDSRFGWVAYLGIAAMYAYLARQIYHVDAGDPSHVTHLWTGFVWFILIGWQVVSAVVGFRESKTRVETDPFGITVVNRWRTHRFRWADVDAIVFDGRRSITLLTRDKVVACDALTWQKRAPRSLRRATTGPRPPLDAAAAWLAETLAYRSAYV